MKNIMWIRRYVFIFGSLMMLGACATGSNYADVMDRKIAQVQMETKEPITTLAFVQTKQADEPDIRIVQEQVKPQDIEAAAGDADINTGGIY